MNKPNVLYIYPDQLRYDALSLNGNPLIQTPNIDELAKDGCNFDQAYSSFPLCCPFRASVMTGKYAHNHGLFANHYPIPTNQEFLPELLNSKGYHTAWIGKWHLNGGKKQDFVEKHLRCGFADFIGFSRGHEYRKSVYYKNDDRTPRKSKDFEPIYQTRHLFEEIDKAIKLDKPFFDGICYGMPHYPLVAPTEYLEMFSPEDVPVSVNVPKKGEKEAREFLAKYYGLVKMVDDEIGKIIQGLKERGIYDNTLIIFVSDHGDFAGEYGRYDKRLINNSSMHVPFIIRYPKNIESKRTNTLVDPSVDIFPTILDYCGIDIPNYCDGISLKEQLEGLENPKCKDYVLFENTRQPFESMDVFCPAERGIRTQRYCYMECEKVPTELFDEELDSNETINRIDDPNYIEVKKELHEKLESIMAISNDDWDRCFSAPLKEYQRHGEAKKWGEELYNRAVLSD
jgi:arylsulfatase A-like enzyme